MRLIQETRGPSLWFADKADYSRIGSGDMIETVGLADLLEGKPDATIKLRVTSREGKMFEISISTPCLLTRLSGFELALL
ncbi:hypothetical protein BDP27DRAFT_912607 [Rhodocollybia butyracea]|uniref:Uncharacterized protein n=1 Tax=Rhodocollybia butyracea TaxID=206335 RepID=A0A9P5TW16_9AGAR|nr:hypothetical protein BDP27DRAFT_912607 [Rhodocollybia butyracea]